MPVSTSYSYYISIFMIQHLIKISLSLFIVGFVFGCGKHDGISESSDMLSSSAENTGQGGQNQPGVITAGEWNDLDNWAFWTELLEKDKFKGMPNYWSLFNNHRVSVQITTDGGQPVGDAVVQLKRSGTTIFTTRTNNKGKAELWVDLLQKSQDIDYTVLTLDINQGAKIISEVKPYHEGVNTISLVPPAPANNVDICLVVDATGSMGDELEYLKTELVDVLSRVQQANPNTAIMTSSVFYRDIGDEYVTRTSAFTTDHHTTIDFIKVQSAQGGGDFPEAVHTALEKSISALQWSAKARARILFLVLDAPPHHNTSVIESLRAQVKKAAELGIRIIPVTASGIDKNTEFLMRFFAMTTNGTYVFITDHSGVGNSHLEASVGDYQVEFLNDLMVRLINAYVE